VPNDDIIVTSMQHAVVTAAIRQWRRCCQLVCSWRWTFWT